MDNPQGCPEQDGLMAPAKSSSCWEKSLRLSRQQMKVLSCQDQHICGCLRDEDSLNEAGNQ